MRFAIEVRAHRHLVMSAEVESIKDRHCLLSVQPLKGEAPRLELPQTYPSLAALRQALREATIAANASRVPAPTGAPRG